MISFLVPSSNTSNLRRSHSPTMAQSSLSSVNNGNRSSWIQQRMFLFSSTPHGAHTARSSFQSGINSASNTPKRRTSSLPNLTQPLTKLPVSNSADTQPSTSFQVTTRKVSNIRAIGILKLSRSILLTNQKYSGKLQLEKTLMEQRSSSFEDRKSK